MFLPDDPQQIDTVVLAAFQPYVQDDEVRLPGADRRQRTRAVSGGAGLVTLVAEDAADQHPDVRLVIDDQNRSEEHTSELQSLMRISYAVFCLKKKKQTNKLITCSHRSETIHH